MNNLQHFVFFYILTTIYSNSMIQAQTTWVTTQYLQNGSASVHHDSTNVGPEIICLTNNQKILTLQQVNQNGDENIYIVDSLGTTIGNHIGSYSGGIYSEDCSALLPTYDNGYVYILNHINIPGYTKIFRIKSSGSWSITYNQSGIGIFNAPEYIIPTFHNTFYIKFHFDSLVEVDDNGNFIRNRQPFSGYIHAIPDSELIVTDALQISRQDFNGSTVWSIPAQSYAVIYADSQYVYARTGGFVKKLKTSDGSLIWNVPVLNDKIAVNSSGEFLALVDNINQLSKYDSSGVLHWSKIIDFTNYNLTAISAGPNLTWITGGCWSNRYFIPSSYPTFSPMLISLDSAGNGRIDSTDYFYVGNANDNSELSFEDDAVFIAAAFNNIGLARNYVLRNDHSTIYNNSLMNVFATDWSDSFPCGPNYKYADYDGNGLIDAVDIRKLAEIPTSYSYGFSPHWQNKLSSNPIPTINFSFESNSITSITDTIRGYITLGSTTLPVDSIYGISLGISFTSNPILYETFQSQEYVSSSFGDTSLNLYYFGSEIPYFIYIRSIAVLCRTDHQNVSVAGDTILKIKSLLNPSFPTYTPVFAYLVWNAIDKNGCDISLNYTTDTLQIQIPNNISNPRFNSFQISPQPADEYIFLKFDNPIESIQIYSSTEQFQNREKNFN
jgi:hypothetical protein